MEETNTRQSSKLSLGSSPSILSVDEDQLDLDASLSALEDDDDSLLSPLSILQTGSPGSLSNEEALDDPSERDDSASSLSSAPDDFPLSRSASPEVMDGKKRRMEEPLKKINSSPEDEPPKKRPRLDSFSKEKEEIEEEKIEKEKEQEKIEENDEDYQQRHKEALDALTQIELEFARLRDKMYQEKMTELNDEANMIANGTHPELVTLMTEIEDKKGKRISSAEAWRRHQYDNFKRQYEGFEYQANIHFMSEKNALRRELLSSINGKKWSVESERKKLHELPDRLFPDGREMILHKRETKEETSELIDIKESIGFPMAPNPRGLRSQDIDEDLRLLGIHNS
ncbi:hypothetical protein G6F56_010387 [Rhizopus delemar]|nr:hypothetical protein G6F56_010387 [Rhizopus delemar]